jgi:polyvinyl alcohol dehydrogenase (cytochrome)
MKRTILVFICIVLIFGFTLDAFASVKDKKDSKKRWLSWGGNLHNTHYAEKEKDIGPDNVGDLTVEWAFDPEGEVSVIPTYVENIVYFADWGTLATGGNLTALNAETSEVIWSKKIAEYTSTADPNTLHTVVRTSPTIYGGILVVGTQWDERALLSGQLNTPPEGSYVLAVNRHNGNLLWITKVEEHPMSLITQSPAIYKGKVYVGVSSLEELAAAYIPEYQCCTFRGSMLALDLNTGEILWKKYTTPEPPDGTPVTEWYTGAAIWGSQPVIDKKRKAVYIATGNNYNSSAEFEECAAPYIDENGIPIPEHYDDIQACVDLYDPPDNYFDSVVAYGLDTGEVRWAHKVWDFDSWNTACLAAAFGGSPENCPEPFGPDYDFGQAPMLIENVSDPLTGKKRDILFAGQKSGFGYGLNPDNGEFIWATVAGPGGILGGFEFGSATDGKRIYYEITNLLGPIFGEPYFMIDGTLATGGFWGALDAATGEILWQTLDPLAPENPFDIFCGPGSEDPTCRFDPLLGGYYTIGAWANAMGPLTVANGVLYGGSLTGYMYGLDSETGEIIWSHQTEGQGAVMSAPTIIDGAVYWGSGYKTGYSTQSTFYKFTLPE